MKVIGRMRGIVAAVLLLPSFAFAAWRTDAPRSYETTIGSPTPIPSRGGGLFLGGYDTVVRVASPGGTLVREALPPPGVSRLVGVVALADGGLVAAGYGESGQSAVFRTNPDGSLRWLRHPGSRGYEPTYDQPELQLAVSEAIDRVVLGVPGGATFPAAVVAVDLDGRVQWMRSDASFDFAMQTLALQGTRLVVGGSRGCGLTTLMALDAVDGETEWTSHPAIPLPACIGNLVDAAVVGGGVVVAYTVASGSTLPGGFGALRVDAATGVQTWSFRDPLANSRALALVPAGTRAVVAGAFNDDSSVLVFFDAATGQIASRVPRAAQVLDVAERAGAIYVAGSELRQSAPRVGTLERYSPDGDRAWATSYAGALATSQTSVRAVAFGDAGDDPIVHVQGWVSTSPAYRAATYAAADGALLGEAAEVSAVDAPVDVDDLGDGTIAEIRLTQDASGPAFVVRRIRRDDQVVLWSTRIARTNFGGASVLPFGDDLLFLSGTQSGEQRIGNTSIVTESYALRRLDGATGAVEWSRGFLAEVPWTSGPFPGQHLSVGPEGFVYWTVLSSLFDSFTQKFRYSMQVRRIDPASGAATWLRTLYGGEWLRVPSAPWLHAVAGGVVLASTAQAVPNDPGSAYERLDATTGATAWRRPIAVNGIFTAPGAATGGDLVLAWLDVGDTPYRTVAERIDPANGSPRWSRYVPALDGAALGVNDVAAAGDAVALLGSRYVAPAEQSEVAVLDASTGATRQAHRVDIGMGRGSYGWLLPSATGFDAMVNDGIESGVTRLRTDGSMIGHHALMVDFALDGSPHDELVDCNAIGADSRALLDSISRPRRSHVELTEPLSAVAGDLRVTMRLAGLQPDRGGTRFPFEVEVVRADALPGEAVNVQIGADPAGVLEIDSCLVDAGSPCFPTDAGGTVRLRTSTSGGQRITISGAVLLANNQPATEIVALATFDRERPDATPGDNAARDLARLELLRDGFE